MPSSTLSPARPGAGNPAPNGPEFPGQRIRNRLAHPAVLLFVILTAQLMVVLDATIVNVALPHIQQSLGFSTSALSWVINAYILTFGGFLLLGARAGDLFGRRRVFLIGLAVFTVSSLVGGFATTGSMLLVARAVQGIGAAFAAPSALSLLTTSFPEGPQRVRAIGLYTTVSAAGGATGLVAGGLLTELVSWRWVMFVNVPIGLAVFVVGRLVLAETERRHGHHDLIGAVGCTVGVTGIVLGLVQAGAHGWTDPVTLASLIGGAVVLAAFLRHEGRATEPILPLSLLAGRTRNAANGARALLYAGFYGLFFFLGQFFQDVQGFSPIVTGLAFLPIPISVFVSSQFTSRVLMVRLPQKAVMVLGAAVASVGLLLATGIHADSSYLRIVVSLVLMGVGSGSTFVTLTTASLADVEPGVAGAASGLVNVSQQLGAAVGLAVLVTVFNAGAGHARLGPGAGASQDQALHSLHAVFVTAALFALASLVTIAAGVRRSRRPAIEVAVDDVDTDDATEEIGADAFAIDAA